jgi:hypothetical protein
MQRLARLAYSLATAALINLAACGGDAPEATFSKATDLQKQRAITAGAGMDAALGFLMGSALSDLPTGPGCPSISRSGDTVTATFDCTDADGERTDGKVTAKNVPGFFSGAANDPTKPAVVTFDGLVIDDTSDDDEDMALDGVVTLDPDGSITAELSATLADIEVHSDATWVRTGDRSSATAGSSIDMDVLGRAEIEGSWNLDSEAPAGVLELHGAEVLKADFDRIAGNCVPLTVDGLAAGQLCDDSNE